MTKPVHSENRTSKLDRDAADMVRLQVGEATELGLRALQSIGYCEPEAKIIIDQLIDNSLCGYRFTGLPRILAIRDDDKTHKSRHPISIDHETPASALVNGGNNVGYIAASFGTDLVIAKALKTGMASVGVYNSFKSGRNAYYVERIVNAGLVAIHTASGKPFVVPYGGARPTFGTNPISIGLPSSRGPVVLDMATASMQLGEVALSAHLGEELPEGIGVDAQGVPSRDASKVLEGGVSTIAGYKGSGLAFAIQALGLLSGASLARGNLLDYAFLFIAIDPKLFFPNGNFPDMVSELVDTVKATPRRPGVDEIRLPGERAFRERERRRVEGILVDRKVVDSLRELCAGLA
jgi:LDH2 family malate/lactate/ureidoglycolate dehydrogenase